MSVGTVKFFNGTKGFGFIIPEEEGGKDVFVHVSGLAPGATINEGDRVNYELSESPKGPCATNVSLADSAPAA